MIEKNKELKTDLLGIVKRLLDKKKFILKATLIGIIVGCIIAFSIPKEYSTTVVFKTSSKSTASGNMGALASLAGINLNSMQESDALTPELYPDVIKSTPFVQELFSLNVVDSEQGIDTILFTYYESKQSKAWWTYILDLPSKFSEEVAEENGRRRNSYVSKKEKDVIESITNSYSISTDKKTGLTTLKVTSQSPIISAFLADTLITSLQRYIIDQRTKKAKTDLLNSENLYIKAQADYYKSQNSLAEFVDANKNVISAKYKIKQEKIQNETNLAYTIYNQMAQQVQMNRLRVQDDTPIFIIIQPAVEALFPESPKKKVIVLSMLFLAITFSSSWILKKEIWSFINK